MANEQTVNISYSVINGNFRHRIRPGALQFNQNSGKGGTPGVIAITTATEVINFGDTAPGFIFLRNLSTGARVSVFTTGGVQIMDFRPGSIGFWEKGTLGYSIRATTVSGTANVDIRSFAT